MMEEVAYMPRTHDMATSGFDMICFSRSACVRGLVYNGHGMEWN
jgi:hypothetical protein